MTEIVLIRGQRHEVHECITCGVFYTCPEVTIAKQRRDGGYHTCSNGHSHEIADLKGAIRRIEAMFERDYGVEPTETP